MGWNIGAAIRRTFSPVTNFVNKYIPPPAPPPPPRNYEAEKYRDERDEARRNYNSYVDSHKTYDPINIKNARVDEREKIPKRLADTQSNLNTDFNSYLKKKNTYLDVKNSIVLSTFDVFLKKTQAEINDLITDVTNENVQIQKQLQHNITYGNKSKYVKSDYQQIEVDKLMSQNKIFWYIFYGLVFILGITIYFYYQFKNVFLLVILFLLLLYPLFMYPLELILYYIYIFLKRLLDTTPFSNIYLGDF